MTAAALLFDLTEHRNFVSVRWNQWHRSMLTSSPTQVDCPDCKHVYGITSTFSDVYTTEVGKLTFKDWYSESNTPPFFHPSSYERGFVTSAYVGMFVCTLGIAVNFMLFTLFLSSRTIRSKFHYCQILNIALADMSYIVTVDSFTVYFELQAWRLGSAFCKIWMILDVALPSVSLVGLLLLNLDRTLFAYKTSFYQRLIQRETIRVCFLLCPWFLSGVIVNSFWLGFPVETVDHLPGACVYGITKEANVASMWLTVFLPCLLIFVLLIFIFIALIGEMPSTEITATVETVVGIELAMSAHPENKASDSNETEHIMALRNKTSTTSPMISGCQQRFVIALLVVDVLSLAITLPYSAYTQVNISCDSPHTCLSFVALFQILSWMKSSVTCVRPLLFILLTDIYLSFKKGINRCFLMCSYNRGRY